MKYRIKPYVVTVVGSSVFYKIQKRVLFFFWKTINERVIAKDAENELLELIKR
jgi:hypothetical protein